MMSVASWAQDSSQQSSSQQQQQTQPATTATSAKKSATSANKPATAKKSTGPVKKPSIRTTKAGAAKTAAKTSAAKPAAKPVDPNADHPTPEEMKAMTINPEVIFDTSMGKMKCELFPKQAPKTVANFIGLAQGTKHWTDPKTGQKVEKPLYDGTIFHRVIPNFMIQGGDPLGNGTGDPGYRFNDELVPGLEFDKAGRLAMANSGPNTNGSQFFITEIANPHLNACFDEGGCDRGGRHVEKNSGYTIFGQCDDASVELVKQIARVATDPRNNRPDLDVTLNHVEILGGPKKPVVARKPTVTKRTIPKKTSAPQAPKS